MTIRITFGGNLSPVDVPDDLATALHAALTEQRNVAAPVEAGFDNLLSLITRQTHVVTHLSLSREVAMAAADSTSEHANRRAIGLAAGMVPSQVGDVLERNGRPRNRRDGTVVYNWELKVMGGTVEAGAVRAENDDQAVEFAVRDANVRQVDAADELDDPFDLVVCRRGRSTGPNSWIEYDATVVHVLPKV
ncbi:hypothetical protein [Kitasatospora griseola]|uniref:hypothetical protein n=1 Tax=Kitasatospora griseola TaxID=2064 RepID=UPI0034168392